jgi:fatty-acyl-CoA synthase
MTIHTHGDRPYEWVGALSERRAQLSPDRVGLVDADTGEAYTYAELDRRANRAARLLRQRGVGRGDRVAVVSRNRPALVDLYFATAKVGAVVAPLSHRLAPSELAALLADVGPSLLVVEGPFAEDVRAAREQVERKATAPPVLGLPAEAAGATGDATEGQAAAVTDAQAADATATDWPAYPSALPTEDSPVETVERALSDPHMFLHTGGSTGLPKEVVLTHGSIAWNAFNTVLSWGLRPDDVTPMVFPMFHTGGWNVLTIPLFHIGGTVIIARDFEPDAVLGLVEEYACSVLVAVPAVLRFMVEADAWTGTDLSSLRFAKSGGGPCREAIIEAWTDRGIDLSQGYGLTECGPNNFTMPEDFGQAKTDAIGMPSLYVDARVVDDDGDPVAQGEVGELELASPHAADRYWHNPEETAATFDEGWVSTGDLARVDEDGYYYIEGRKKNLFVSGGENVYPPEVEDALADHPKVEEAIVVPVDDETWGQVGKAVVQGDDRLTLEALQDFLEGRLATFKIPEYLTFVDEMPLGGANKIQRAELEAAYGGEP